MVAHKKTTVGKDVAPRSRSTLEQPSRTRKTSLNQSAQTFGEDTGGKAEVEDSSVLNRVARAALDSACFKTFLNLIILCNSITVGLDQSARVAGYEDAYVTAAEHAFLAVYCIELSMHLIASGRAAFNDGWVVFDGILVALAILAFWILPTLNSLFGMQDFSPLGLALVLRTARLLRLARAVRLIKAFRQLWMLVFAFLSSAKIMVYVIVMLGFFLYIFSSIAVELITLRYKNNPDAPPEILEMVDIWFPTLFLTMLTLLQFVCMDSIGSIYRPLIEHDWALAWYFTGVILVVSIVLMNIVTAVIVNSALQQSADDAEMMLNEELRLKEVLMQDLQAMFHRIDADGSGSVGIEELKCITGEDAKLLNQCSNFADVVDVFKALDIDDGGTLNIEEFCEGLYQVSMSNTPIEMKRICKQLDRILALETALNNISGALLSRNPEATTPPCSKPMSPKDGGAAEDAWEKGPLETVVSVAKSSVEAVVEEAAVNEPSPREFQSCDPPGSPVKFLSAEMQMSEQRVLNEIRTSFSTLQKLWTDTVIDLQPAGATPAHQAPGRNVALPRSSEATLFPGAAELPNDQRCGRPPASQWSSLVGSRTETGHPSCFVPSGSNRSKLLAHAVPRGGPSTALRTYAKRISGGLEGRFLSVRGGEVGACGRAAVMPNASATRSASGVGSGVTAVHDAAQAPGGGNPISPPSLNDLSVVSSGGLPFPSGQAGCSIGSGNERIGFRAPPRS